MKPILFFSLLSNKYNLNVIYYKPFNFLLTFQVYLAFCKRSNVYKRWCTRRFSPLSNVCQLLSQNNINKS